MKTKLIKNRVSNLYLNALILDAISMDEDNPKHLGLGVSSTVKLPDELEPESEVSVLFEITLNGIIGSEEGRSEFLETGRFEEDKQSIFEIIYHSDILVVLPAEPMSTSSIVKEIGTRYFEERYNDLIEKTKTIFSIINFVDINFPDSEMVNENLWA